MFLCIFFLVASYECNLRAYLMQVPYQKAVNSEEDLLELGQDMYIPLGTPFKALFKDSPIESQQKLFQKTESAGHYFYFESGSYPAHLHPSDTALVCPYLPCTRAAWQYIHGHAR